MQSNLVENTKGVKLRRDLKHDNEWVSQRRWVVRVFQANARQRGVFAKRAQYEIKREQLDNIAFAYDFLNNLQPFKERKQLTLLQLCSQELTANTIAAQ